MESEWRERRERGWEREGGVVENERLRKEGNIWARIEETVHD